MPADPHQVKRVFADACDLESQAAVDAFLVEACSQDDGLRAEVDSLLAAQQAANVGGGFLAEPQVGAGAALFKMLFGGGGGAADLGPYRVIRLIGEGGFGAVFLAEQTRPIRRHVALKVVRPGMDTLRILARFEAERRAMARVEHPNVARIYDAGATPAGRPYIAMELVRGGRPITDFCDAHRLNIRARVRLMVPVCLALHAAHERGVIHRDIKPSNVLVAVHDRRPVPKVIDFGIAKAVSADRSGEEPAGTPLTEVSELVGTPAYSAPEQLHGGEAQVDARTDVYGLGALLYEMLTGAPPIEVREIGSALSERVRRLVQDADPPRPSRRLLAAGGIATEVAARRGTDSRRLRRALTGDLDQIVMRCLEKELARRYASAAALADDLRCYLETRPVAARPSSLAYRLTKTLRRRRTIVIAAGLATAAAGIGLAVGAVVARRSTAAAQTSMPPTFTGTASTRRAERVVDLLALINPARDAVAGSWAKDAEGRLIGQGGEQPARLRIPYVPPSDYNFIIEFTAGQGDGPVLQMCPLPRGMFLWQVAWDGYGFEGARGLPSGKRPLMKRGTVHRSIVSVRASRVEAHLDGALVAAFDPTQYTLAFEKSVWQMPSPPAAGIGIWNSRVTFTKVEMVEIGGAGLTSVAPTGQLRK
jgi:serine/threonine protein kinase